VLAAKSEAFHAGAQAMTESNKVGTAKTLPYPARFKRVLTLKDLIIYGIVFITPTAPYPVFGIVGSIAHGHVALTYLIGMVAMMLTALSYGRMATAFPAAGSTYTFTQRGLNPHLGFFAGWSMFLDYLLIPLLSVIYVGLTLHRIVPSIPYGFWVILSAAVITAINLMGIKMTARANQVMMVAMLISVAWFMASAVAALLRGVGQGTLLSIKPFYDPENFSLSAVMTGSSVAALSYIGFDGVTTLSEDVEKPERNVLVATVLVCFLSAAFNIFQTYLAQLVWPNFRGFHDIETAFLDVSQLVGGSPLFHYVTFVLLVAGLGSALGGQAGASRLLFGMGRDEVLPRRFFAYLHPKYNTPTYNVLLLGGFAGVAAFFIDFQLAAELVNFGAFLGFICVNLAVINHFFLRGGKRIGGDFLNYLLAPALGFLFCLYIWVSLRPIAMIVGFSWLALGTVYAAILTKGFRKPPKSIDFHEAE
jgi:putrescine importer